MALISIYRNTHQFTVAGSFKHRIQAWIDVIIRGLLKIYPLYILNHQTITSAKNLQKTLSKARIPNGYHWGLI
jgi:hypothetical protein